MNCKLFFSLIGACLIALSFNTASAAIINLEANIDGAQANAGIGTGSPATGFASMTFDDATNLFSWDINYSVNDLLGVVTVAHFHGPATVDVSAGVQVPIDNPEVVPIIGSATINNVQKDQLLAGLWYINIHTTSFVNGEIRGQVNVVPIPAAVWLFGSGLLGLIGIARRKKV